MIFLPKCSNNQKIRSKRNKRIIKICSTKKPFFFSTGKRNTSFLWQFTRKIFQSLTVKNLQGASFMRDFSQVLENFTLPAGKVNFLETKCIYGKSDIKIAPSHTRITIQLKTYLYTIHGVLCTRWVEYCTRYMTLIINTSGSIVLFMNLAHSITKKKTLLRH